MTYRSSRPAAQPTRTASGCKSTAWNSGLKQGLLYLAFFASLWLLRSVYTMPIESGGDALKKWNYVATFDMPSATMLQNHHTMRWAVTLPGIAAYRLAGGSASAYYLAPLTAFSAGVTILLMMARRTLAPLLAAGFVVAIFMDPMMHRASTQFQPIAFGFMYASASLACAVRWTRRHADWWLVAATTFAFLAYGAKAPYGYFFPGILAYFLYLRGWRPALFSVCVFGSLFSFECLVFNSLSDEILPLGRLSAILNTHRPGTTFGGSVYADYFLQWTRISWFNQLVSAGALIPFWGCCIAGKCRKVPRLVILTGCMLTSYHALNTFLVVDFGTMQTPQPALPRYLAVTMPFACLALFAWGAKCDAVSRTPLASAVLLGGAASLLVIHVLLGKQPRYLHNRLHYPSRGLYFYGVEGHYCTVADWLKRGNVVSVNSAVKARALRVLLKNCSGGRRIAIRRGNEDELHLRMRGSSRGTAPSVAKYRFSQFTFAEPRHLRSQ